MQLGRWFRYFRHIPPRKVAGKIAHAAKVRAISYFPRLLIKPWCLQPGTDYEPLMRFASVYECMGDRFDDAHLLETGTFSVKGVQKEFGSLESVCWDNAFPDEPEKLHWMHDLAFFSFAIALVRGDAGRGVNTLARLVAALETRHAIGQGRFHFVWSPIALSLRIMGLACAAALARRSGVELSSAELKTIELHIAFCAGLLDSTAERYLGYNHNAFAEMALLVASCATGNDVCLAQRANQAAVAIRRHVLEDGLWEERSPTYHIHMLLLARALVAMDLVTGIGGTQFKEVAQNMLEALSVLVHSDGEIAVLNDAAIEDSVAPASVGWAQPLAEVWHGDLPDAGYAQLRRGETSLIFDAGIMGPDDVIGHGHGDFLSVEACWKGQRLLVDPGVRSITSGKSRQETRSATLHNGPGFEGCEPAEFFGTWRVGRRGRAGFTDRASTREGGTLTVEGSCDGYSPFTKGQDVRRRVSLHASGEIEIIDSWPASTPRRRVALLIPATWKLSKQDPQSFVVRCGDLQATFRIENGAVRSPIPDIWCPRGPMQPLPANLFVVDIYPDVSTSTVRISQ